MAFCMPDYNTYAPAGRTSCSLKYEPGNIRAYWQVRPTPLDFGLPETSNSKIRNLKSKIELNCMVTVWPAKQEGEL